jgi:IMP dehydrogenase/GMP reductase
MLYSLDEICLIPTAVSKIEHRGDVNVFTNKNNYPIFTAPMASIVDASNVNILKDRRLNVIVPRSVAWEKRLEFLQAGDWVAVGLKEAQYIYDYLELQHFTVDKTIRLCIDQANGHMESLLKICKDLKLRFGTNIKIMTGNIANPYAYREYAKAGVDYVRAGIGGGNVCTTSVQTGIHYPMGSLLIKLNEERDYVKKSIELGARYMSTPKIIADGGFKRIDQCVKALALGADFVMLGEIIAKSDEACGEIVAERNKYGFKSREYFGMSTEKAQAIVNDASLFKVDNFVPKHSEGQIKTVDVEYTLSEWLGDFDHALRSSMSYTGARRLEEFIGKVNWDNMSPVTFKAYMK